MASEKKVWTRGDFDKELVSIQGKAYVPIGPKLRTLREHFPNAAVSTEIVTHGAAEDAVTVRAIVTAGDRAASAYGTSSIQSDRALGDSLLELAETRAVARALRFFGIGVDSTGAEEVQGRRPLADREKDEPKPLDASEKPTPGQLRELRSLVADLKAARVDVSDVEPPETTQAAADLIERLAARLKEARP